MSGLSQMSRWQLRCSRATCCRSTRDRRGPIRPKSAAHGPAVQHPAHPPLMERPSASPIRVPPDQSGTAPAHRRPPRRAARAQLVRDPRQRRREHERFDPRVPSAERVREVQEHPRVALHRSADVAQQHDRPAGARAGPPRQRMTSPPVRRLPASARRRSMRGPAPRTHRRVRRSPGFQTSRSSAARARQFVRGELGEVLRRERRGRAPGPQAHRPRLHRHGVAEHFDGPRAAHRRAASR